MHIALVHVGELLNQRTAGRIRLRIEPRRAIPSQMDIVARSDRELAMVSLAGLASYHPPLAAFEAPYVFRDVDHFYRTVRSRIGKEVISEAERQSGLHVLGVWHQGLRQVTLRDRPATTPEEFGNIKLRVPASMMFVEAAKTLGALPTTMPFSNVHIALRAGVIDGQENPLPTIYAMGVDEVCRYLVLTSHMIGSIAPVIGSDLWQRLAKADQEIVEQAFQDGGARNRRIVEEEESRLLAELAAGGMTVLRPELEPFRRRAEQSWRRFNDIWGDSLVARIQQVQ